MWHEWPCPMAMEEIQAKKRDGQLSRMRKSCAVGVWEIFCWEGLEVIYIYIYAIVMYLLHLERRQEIACRFSTCVFRSSSWSCSFSANRNTEKSYGCMHDLRKF